MRDAVCVNARLFRSPPLQQTGLTYTVRVAAASDMSDAVDGAGCAAVASGTLTCTVGSLTPLTEYYVAVVVRHTAYVDRTTDVSGPHRTEPGRRARCGRARGRQPVPLACAGADD